MTRLIILISFLLAGSLTASALTLDWSTVTWTAGSTSGSFDLDGDATDDITISISGATASLNSGYPANGTEFDGGGAGDNSLGLKLDFSNSSSTVIITVYFINMIGADDVVLTLLDIDADRNGASSNYKFRDQLTGIYGNFSSNSIAPTISVASTSVNTLSGTGVLQTVTANQLVSDTGGSSGNGTVGISYGQTLHNATISFGNGPGVTGGGDPDPQGFAIFDISFNKHKIPEAGTTLACLGFCAAALIGRHFRKWCQSLRPR